MGETPKVMVYAGHINETTTLCLPTEDEWRQATSKDHNLRYIKRILFFLEEKPIDPKYLRNNGYARPFQKGLLYLNNGLIFYYGPHAQTGLGN